MNNKIVGNNFEREFCDLLFEHGFWAHNFQQNASGQPADVIAIKDDKAYLIDCKHCSGSKGFALSRIEDNQRLAMKLWLERTNGEAYFAIKYEMLNEIYLITYKNLIKHGEVHSYLSYVDAIVNGISIEEFINGS